MKYLKKFEKLKEYNVGDIVIWNQMDPIMLSHTLGVAPYSKNTDYGDKCKITKTRTFKGKPQVKLFNITKNVPVNKFLDDSLRVQAPYNSEGHWINAINNWYITKPENFKWTLINAIQNEKIEIVRELANISNVNKPHKEYTPLILAAFKNNLEIVEILIDAGADWIEKRSLYDGFAPDENSKKDFLEYLNDKNKKYIINKYPDKYKEYLTQKTAEKYNL